MALHCIRLLCRCAVCTDKYVVCGCDDGHVMVCDIILGEVVHRFKAHDGMSAAFG